MAKLAIKKASTDVTVYVFIQDSSKTTGAGLTGLVYNTTDLVASYVRPLAARQALSLATLAAVDSAHSDGGFKEIDATNMPGVYRLDLPDAVCATGVNSVVVMLKGAANMAPVVLEIQLTDFDLNTAGVSLADDAITSAKFDESTAFPVKSADTGATQIARVGADSDTLETLSDQLDAIKTETDSHPTATEIVAAIGSSFDAAVASVVTIEDSDTLIIYRDTTVVISFAGLGDVSAYAAAGDIAWFTIKENLDDADTSAILQMKTTSFGDSGAASTLLYVNGAAPTASDEGSFLFSDYVTGAATATLKAVAAVDLPVYAVTPVYWDIKATTAAGVVTILATGTAYIYATSTRTIS